MSENDDRVRAVLRRTKDLLVRDGWKQRGGGPESPAMQGERCLLGALYAGAPVGIERAFDMEGYYGAHQALQTVLNTGKTEYVNIIAWNDDPSRKVGEVLNVIDFAIELREYTPRPQFKEDK